MYIRTYNYIMCVHINVWVVWLKRYVRAQVGAPPPRRRHVISNSDLHMIVVTIIIISILSIIEDVSLVIVTFI